MQSFLERTRFYDFHGYYGIYQAGLNSPALGSFFYFFAKYGIIFFFLSFTYLIWMKKIRAFLCTLLAMGVAGLVDFIVMMIWKRPRPFVTYVGLVGPEIEGMRVDMASFPSSHTYVAFAIATSVFLYGHKRLGSFLFILAILVALSRIGAGLHYPSDVIGGTLLGIASGVFVYLLVRNWEEKKTN